MIGGGCGASCMLGAEYHKPDEIVFGFVWEVPSGGRTATCSWSFPTTPAWTMPRLGYKMTESSITAPRKTTISTT